MDFFEGLKTERQRREEFMAKAAALVLLRKTARVAAVKELLQNPYLRTGAVGAAVGGAGGALTGEGGGDRLKRGLVGAAAGGALGGLGRKGFEDLRWGAKIRSAKKGIQEAEHAAAIGKAQSAHAVQQALKSGLKVPREMVPPKLQMRYHRQMIVPSGATSPVTGGTIPTQFYGLKAPPIKKVAHLPSLPSSAGSSVGATDGGELSAKIASPFGPIDEFDPRERAVERYPVEEVPSGREEAETALSLLEKNLRKAQRAKARLIYGPKRGREPKLPAELQRKTASAGQARAASILPGVFRSKAGLGIMGTSALGLGLLNYLTSRPKKSLGGMSSAEEALTRKVRANIAEAGEDDPLRTRVRHRMDEFRKGLATEFRKSPAAAGVVGAAVGAGVGSQLARILGAVR